MRINISENWQIDFDRLREDLVRDSQAAFFGGGFGGALSEAAQIEIASEDELARIAERKGVDLRNYIVFSDSDITKAGYDDEYDDYDSDDEFGDYDSDDASEFKDMGDNMVSDNNRLKNHKNAFSELKESSLEQLESLQYDWYAFLNRNRKYAKGKIFNPSHSTVEIMKDKIRKYREEVKDFGIKYETLLSRTSDKAKKCFCKDKAINYEIKLWMNGFITDVFDAMEKTVIEISFDNPIYELKRLNGKEIKHRISAPAKRIKIWWADELNDDSYRGSYEDNQKKILAETTQKKIDNRKKAKEEYDELLRIYAEESPIIQKIIDDETNNVLEDMSHKLKSNLDKNNHKHDPGIEQAINELQWLNSQIALLTKQMNKLHLFSKGLKRELSKKIDELNYEKSSIEHKVLELQANKFAEANYIIDLNKKEKDRLIDEIKKRNPLPLNPDNTDHLFDMFSSVDVDLYKRFNWARYGVDISKIFEDGVERQYKLDELVIGDNEKWYMTSNERRCFLNDFLSFYYHDEEMKNWISGGDELSFFLKTHTYDGVEVTYCINSGDVKKIMVTKEEYSSCVFTPGFFGMIDLFKKYGDIDLEDVYYIKRYLFYSRLS